MPTAAVAKTVAGGSVFSRIPAWGYGLIGFAAVAVVLIIVFLLRQGLPAFLRNEGPLQGGTVWTQQLSNARNNPTTPVLADINGDKFLDVIVADADRFILAMDGQEGKKIFEVNIDNLLFLAPPAIADLTGDDIMDLVLGSNAGIVVAVNGKGKTIWQSSGDLNLGQIVNRPVFHELTGDKVYDVVVPTEKKGLVALDGSRGWEIWNTAEMTQGSCVTTPAKADLNKDGKMDFVVVTDAGHLLAVSSHEKKVWKVWEKSIPQVLYASPLYIKGKDLAIVVVATDGKGVVAVNAENGRTFWAKTLSNSFFASPVGADANGDGIPDVVLTAKNGEIYVLDALTGDEIWSKALGVEIHATPALFDVNQDKLPDLVSLDFAGNLRIIDMNKSRTILEISIPGSNGFLASPVMGDINNDGFLNIITASQNGHIATYQINRTVPKSHATWPIFLGNDQHSYTKK